MLRSIHIVSVIIYTFVMRINVQRNCSLVYTMTTRLHSSSTILTCYNPAMPLGVIKTSLGFAELFPYTRLFAVIGSGALLQQYPE